MLVMLLLGFSSGIPLALTGSTLQAWMTDQKIDLRVIGLFALVGSPYTLKFLWAPFLDRFMPPVLGRRRGWILISQFALILSIAAMGFSNPSQSTTFVATLAVIVAFFSASQDIVIDAYKIEVLPQEEFGVGAGLYTMGYRIAMLVSGAGALMLADGHLSWNQTYLVMAAVMLIGVVTSWFAPEPSSKIDRPHDLKEAFVLPLLEFFRRRGVLEILLFIVLYKLDVAMTMSLSTTFLIQTGFTKTDIASVTKIFGMIATVLGAILGGVVLTRIGLKKSLWIFGILQAAAGLSFMSLAHFGKVFGLMVMAIGVENFCSGMGTAAYSAFLMGLCDRRFSATQYALLSSLMALTRVVATAPTGFMVNAWGWETFFLVSTLSAIPGLILLLRFNRWTFNKA